MPVDEFESLFGDAAAGGSVQGGGEHARSDAVAELALDVRDVPACDADRFAAHGLALSLPRFRCRPPPAVRVRRRFFHDLPTVSLAVGAVGAVVASGAGRVEHGEDGPAQASAGLAVCAHGVESGVHELRGPDA